MFLTGLKLWQNKERLFKYFQLKIIKIFLFILTTDFHFYHLFMIGELYRKTHIPKILIQHSVKFMEKTTRLLWLYFYFLATSKVSKDMADWLVMILDTTFFIFLSPN